MNSNHVLLFVSVSLLIVAIVSSSGLRARALPPDPKYGTAYCKAISTGGGGQTQRTCCWGEKDILNPKEIIRWCQTCDTDSDGNPYPNGCAPPTAVRTLPGGLTTGLLNLTKTRAVPVNPPGGKATGPLNNANAPPASNAATGNPTITGTTGLHNLPINKASSSNTAPDSTILSTHHHKTSNNLGQTSGSASTGNSTGH